MFEGMFLPYDDDLKHLILDCHKLSGKLFVCFPKPTSKHLYTIVRFSVEIR